MSSPKHPCIGCIYFTACGETTRTAPCKGRQTRSRKKCPLGGDGTQDCYGCTFPCYKNKKKESLSGKN